MDPEPLQTVATTIEESQRLAALMAKDAAVSATRAEVEAKGWPTRDVDAELCDERAREFFDLLDARGLREPS